MIVALPPFKKVSPSISLLLPSSHLFQQSLAVSLQVSSSVNISSFTSRDSLPFFYLWSTSSLLFTQLSLQASHFLFLCLALSDTPISSVLCCYQQHNITFVIQGDLQPSLLSVLKDICSHFVYFPVRHSVRNGTTQQRQASSLTFLWTDRQCVGI